MYINRFRYVMVVLVFGLLHVPHASAASGPSCEQISLGALKILLNEILQFVPKDLTLLMAEYRGETAWFLPCMHTSRQAYQAPRRKRKVLAEESIMVIGVKNDLPSVCRYGLAQDKGDRVTGAVPQLWDTDKEIVAEWQQKFNITYGHLVSDERNTESSPELRRVGPLTCELMNLLLACPVRRNYKDFHLCLKRYDSRAVIVGARNSRILVAPGISPRYLAQLCNNYLSLLQEKGSLQASGGKYVIENFPRKQIDQLAGDTTDGLVPVFYGGRGLYNYDLATLGTCVSLFSAENG